MAVELINKQRSKKVNMLESHTNIALMKMKKAERRNLILVFSVIIFLLVLGIFLYFMSRTYVKAWRLGIPITADTLSNFRGIVGRSFPALIGMMGSGFLIAVVSLSFQTITESKILTPSMIGFDAIFVITQTLIIFLLGTNTTLITNPFINYAITAGAMVTISFFMYRTVLRRGKNNMIFLLMFGLVLSGILSSGTRYLLRMMEAYEFGHVQAIVNVTINNMRESIIYMVMPLMVLLSGVILFRHRTYNVMTLGAKQARGLGVDYEKELHFNLILIAIGMSLVTALIGPLAFLGLLAVNFARMVLKTHRHLPLFLVSGLTAAIALVLGQTIVELLEGQIPITVIINLVGCSYIFYYIIKDNKV